MNLVRRDEDVVLFLVRIQPGLGLQIAVFSLVSRRNRFRPHKPKSIPMQIQPPTHQPLTATPNRSLHAIPQASAARPSGGRMSLIMSGSRLGIAHISSPRRASSPRATRRVSCSTSRRRSRPPPRPSSRMSCLYPALLPADRVILASRSRSLRPGEFLSARGYGVRAMA